MGNLGYKHSESAKADIALGLLGNKNSLGHKNFLGFRHSEKSRMQMSKIRKGKSQPTKGKTYEEIYGEEKAKQLKKSRSDSFKEHFKSHRHKLPRPSYHQMKMYEAICKVLPDRDISLEFRVETKNSCRYIDVAVPSMMLAFEYDSDHFHKNIDKNRDQELIDLGWKVIHFHKKNELKYIVGG